MSFTPIRKAAVTVQTLSMLKGKNYYLGFLEEIHLGEAIAASDGKPAKNPPNVARCVQLDTGEIVQALIPAVMASELAKAYPQGVRGVCVDVLVLPPKDGKKYALCNIWEIEAPESFKAMFNAAPAPAAKSAKK